jgi:hypothetical protein
MAPQSLSVRSRAVAHLRCDGRVLLSQQFGHHSVSGDLRLGLTLGAPLVFRLCLLGPDGDVLVRVSLLALGCALHLARRCVCCMRRDGIRVAARARACALAGSLLLRAQRCFGALVCAVRLQRPLVRRCWNIFAARFVLSLLQRQL